MIRLQYGMCFEMGFSKIMLANCTKVDKVPKSSGVAFVHGRR